LEEPAAHGQAIDTKHLTRSFRFGSKIGALSTRLLRLRNEARPVIGCSIKTCDSVGRISPNESLVSFVRRVQGSVLMVSRTNVQLIQGMLDAVAASLRIAALDGVKARLDPLLVVAKCELEKRPVPDDLEDKERATRLVATWGAQETLTRIDSLLQKAVRIDQKPDVVFSTVHRAKGLEYDGVWLVDDFPIITSPSSPFWKWLKVPPPGDLQHDAIGRDDDDYGLQDNQQVDWNEEFNLLYVAVTRAKRAVVLCETLERHRPAMKLLATGDESVEAIRTLFG